MPNGNGAEHTIHARIGEIKRQDKAIIVEFELPSGEHKTLRFESYVTRADLKQEFTHNALAMMLGVRETTDAELDVLFNALDSSKDDMISRSEWEEFVQQRMQALLELYDKINHTKKMGIVYAGNMITDVSAGFSAERQGVFVGWKIVQVSLI